MVGLGQEAGKDFHLPGIELLLVIGEGIPRWHVGIGDGKFRALRDNAFPELVFQGPAGVVLPAAVEAAVVFVHPFLRGMKGRMGRSGGEIQEERLVRRGALLVGDVVDRLGGEAGDGGLAEGVVRLAVGVAVQFRMPLVIGAGGGAETVEMVEAAARGPAVVRAR